MGFFNWFAACRIVTSLDNNYNTALLPCVLTQKVNTIRSCGTFIYSFSVNKGYFREMTGKNENIQNKYKYLCRNELRCLFACALCLVCSVIYKPIFFISNHLSIFLSSSETFCPFFSRKNDEKICGLNI